MIPPIVLLLSFGYSQRVPPPANFSLDVRSAPNPLRIPEFRGLSVLDESVQKWMLAELDSWFDGLLDTLGPQLADAESRDSRALTWAFGCTTGHDQSVVLAELVGAAIRRTGTTVCIKHLDLATETMQHDADRVVIAP
ncbi:RapZ C-terminal domain-containing protein [Saccharopolyspora shandongensis]|uniref:RapZ C-terminal domain-containing protein n=1 Tax=Saccharopolyspora shandongensis TaxID=418495 RepID=UPI001C433C63|nr:RNase adapter RapZ [Saccharopolyspora shandongensis]